MARRRTTHLVRTTYYPANDFQGSKIKVTDLMTEESKTFPYSYKASDPHVDAVLKFTGAEGATYKRGTRTGRGNIYHAWKMG